MYTFEKILFHSLATHSLTFLHKIYLLSRFFLDSTNILDISQLSFIIDFSTVSMMHTAFGSRIHGLGLAKAFGGIINELLAHFGHV